MKVREADKRHEAEGWQLTATYVDVAP